MAPNGSAESRKRKGATSTAAAAPTPTPSTREPAIPWSFKRRKLNADGLPLSSPTTPKTTPATKTSTVKKTRKTEPSSVSAYDVPDSPEDNPPQRLRNVRSAHRPTSKVPIPRRSSGNDVYDIPDSDDELHSSPKEVNSQKTSPTNTKTNDTIDNEILDINSRKSGGKQPSRRADVSGPIGAKQEAATREDDSVKVRSSGRRRILTAKALEVQEEKLSTSRSVTPTSRPRSSAAAHDAQESQNATQRVKRNISKPLKGILTPSRRDKSKRKSKSVAFESVHDQASKEVFFEDLPNKSGKSRKSSQNLVEGPLEFPKTAKPGKAAAETVESVANRVTDVEEQEVRDTAQDEDDEESEVDEEDEDVCSICSKPDSKRGNQILFCDGCDKAFHQKCYGIARVPRGDWHCNDCVDQKETRAAAADKAVNIPNFAQHLSSLQRVLLDRCTGHRRIKLIDQEEAYATAHQLVKQTVLAGEGNSMLIIGARGCGKTTLVESIVDDLSLQHKHEFHVVRLNGFIHTDDKLALKEIWRQLGKEMNAEDEVNARSNYADTMASLLALLSHPSEMAQAEEGVTSQAVVFVIDEFDMFAAHPRQTLLYNLFDIAQARKAPIAVLGCTTRMDVVEMLEKRVKSRFSHRYVYMSLPGSLPAYWKVCKQGLSVDDDDMESEGIDVTVEGHEAFQKNWRAMVEMLNKEKAFQNLLQYHYATSKSVSAFLSECILPLSSLSPASLDLAIPSQASPAVYLTAPNSKLHLLPSLSELDLGLLIAAARLDIVAHTDTVNFAMAYDEYGSLMSRQRLQAATSGALALGGGVRVWGRGVAVTAWERLVSLGLLLPAGLGTGRASGYSGLEGKMWRVDMALEEIPVGVKLNSMLARWCKEI
ncbi:Origin recognition complex subunit 4 [Colletotrichum chlorophyti]|uniref:Origin recognition complex subunit 4 n=1 Tax=Colletotrichum chlorophyti TaxID=708187 RepID=A0A1Q8RUK6_9PEZI|nr:Origin recognition complex subunit 4 [Colletotrichum chlorophyti]